MYSYPNDILVANASDKLPLMNPITHGAISNVNAEACAIRLHQPDLCPERNDCDFTASVVNI